MSSPAHFVHVADHAVRHTSVGKQVTTAAVAGSVCAAQFLGGTALAGVATAAAPVVVPLALVGGIAFLAYKACQSHKH